MHVVRRLRSSFLENCHHRRRRVIGRGNDDAIEEHPAEPQHRLPHPIHRLQKPSRVDRSYIWLFSGAWAEW